MRFFRNKNSFGSLFFCFLALSLYLFSAVFLILNKSITAGVFCALIAAIFVIVFIRMLPFTIKNGIISTSTARKINISDIEAVFLTNYSNTTGMAANPLFTYRKENGKQVNAMYMYLLKDLSGPETDKLDRYHESHTANQYFDKDSLFFRTSYSKKLLACLFDNGLHGKIYIFRQLYEDYSDELREIFERTRADDPIILEYRTDNGGSKPDFTLSGINMHS